METSPGSPDSDLYKRGETPVCIEQRDTSVVSALLLSRYHKFFCEFWVSKWPSIFIFDRLLSSVLFFLLLIQSTPTDTQQV